jgi:uncharacterized membrane protein YgaE (UPF0421/DUF939 family)
MNKVSFPGMVLGLIMGALVALVSGSWIFWLALGIGIGVVIGVVATRRELAVQAARHGASGPAMAP